MTEIYFLLRNDEIIFFFTTLERLKMTGVISLKDGNLFFFLNA